MTDPNNLNHEKSAGGDQTESLQDSEHASIIARLIEVENAVKSTATANETRDKKQDTEGALLDRVKTAERWMIVITILILLVSVFQAGETWCNNESTGKQVDKIIVAADRIDDAADSFSRSSVGINSGVDKAVGNLAIQAANTQVVAQEATTQTEIARQGLHIGNDPILIVPAIAPKHVDPVSTKDGHYLNTR